MIRLVPFGAPGPARPPRLPGPAFWAALVLHLALAAVLAFVPLFNLLGYEFCAALALLASMTAGPVAIATARRRPALLPSVSSPGGIVLSLYLRAFLLNLSTLLLPLAIMLLNALRVRNCNLEMGLLFFLLLPVLTCSYCTAIGTFLGLATQRRFLGGGLYALFWIGVAAYNIAEVWVGPQVDSFNQFAGWLAGPIYDEVVEPGLPLLLSRLQGILWACFALALAAALLDLHLNHLRPGALLLNRSQTAWMLLCGLAALALFLAGPALGFRRSQGHLESVLSGTTCTTHFVLHHSPDLSPDKVKLLAEDHEFRLSQLQHLLGPVEVPTVHSYLFRNEAEKRRLVGAGRTEYTKPWLPAIFLNGDSFPHPTLKHELAHAFAGSFGSWPFGASARALLWVNVGLTEGLAVAAEWPSDPADPHVWSAALRRIGKAPDLRTLFNPVGFWTAAAKRSYTLAGSFVRWLLARLGPGAVRRAYLAGTLEGTLPEPAEQLISGWEAFLDSIPLDETLLEAARGRFSRPGVFDRPCAHEVSALREEALGWMARQRPDRAAEVAGQILGYLPDDPDTEAFLVEAMADQGKPNEAVAAAQKLLDRPDLGPSMKVSTENRLGNLFIRQGKPELAAEHFRKVFEAHLDDPTDRMALIQLQALGAGEAGRKVLKFLDRAKADAAGVIDLLEAALAAPHWGEAWYLLGRQLFLQEAFEPAIRYLRRAGEEGLSHPALAVENLKLLALACYRIGDRQTAAVVLAVLLQFPRNDGDWLFAEDWIERIAFDETTSGG